MWDIEVTHATTAKGTISAYDWVYHKPRSSKDERGVKVLTFTAFRYWNILLERSTATQGRWWGQPCLKLSPLASTSREGTLRRLLWLAGTTVEAFFSTSAKNHLLQLFEHKTEVFFYHGGRGTSHSSLLNVGKYLLVLTGPSNTLTLVVSIFITTSQPSLILVFVIGSLTTLPSHRILLF